MFQKMPENILLSDSSLFSLSRDDEDVYLTVNSKASLTVKEIYASTISGYELNIGTGSSHIQGDLGVNRLLPVDNTSSIGGDGDEYEYGYFNNLDVKSLSVTERLNISGGIQDLTVQNEIKTKKLSVSEGILTGSLIATISLSGDLKSGELPYPHYNNDCPVGGLCVLVIKRNEGLVRGDIIIKNTSNTWYKPGEAGYFDIYISSLDDSLTDEVPPNGTKFVILTSCSYNKKALAMRLRDES